MTQHGVRSIACVVFAFACAAKPWPSAAQQPEPPPYSLTPLLVLPNAGTTSVPRLEVNGRYATYAAGNLRPYFGTLDGGLTRVDTTQLPGVQPGWGVSTRDFGTDAAGRSFIYAHLNPPTSDGQYHFVIWTREGDGPWDLRLSDEMAPPGFPAGDWRFYSSFPDQTTQGAGGTVFHGTILMRTSQPAISGVIYRVGGGGIEPVVVENTPSPIAGLNHNLGLDLLGTFPDGRLAYRSWLSGAGVTRENDEALFVGHPGAMQVLVRKGDPAPGTGGTPFLALPDTNNFSPLTIGHGGHVAFRSLLPGSGDNLTEGLWSGTPGSLSLVARAGDPVPSARPGEVYLDLYDPAVNRDGDVAFQARTVSGVVPNAVYAGTPGDLRLVARAGQPAPGTSSSFSEFTSWGSAVTPIIGDDGWVTFTGRLDSGGKHGVWRASPTGEVHLVALEGQPVDLGDGNVNYIYQIEALPTDGGDPALAIHYCRPDAQLSCKPVGHALLLVNVPEPGTHVALLAGLVLLKRTRRRKA